jgi:hypothetical protein
MIRHCLVLAALLVSTSAALAGTATVPPETTIDTDPGHYPATFEPARVTFEGETAAGTGRNALLQKASSHGLRRYDCGSIESAAFRPLPADAVLPTALDTTSRELWILRQCGTRRGYVVAVRSVRGEPPLTHIWAAGPVAPDGTVAPLPSTSSVTDASVRYEYDRTRIRSGTEYHVCHILVPTREQAQAALDRIHAGESFDAIAVQVSVDTGSASRGGDLAWASDHVYIGPFAQALRGLAPHGLTPAPVQTIFGWHVIEVLGVREAPFPRFDEVKEKIAASMRREITDGI